MLMCTGIGPTIYCKNTRDMCDDLVLYNVTLALAIYISLQLLYHFISVTSFCS